MSTATETRPEETSRATPPAGKPDGVTFARVVRSEWIKFRTLRSSWGVLLGAFLSLIAFGLIFGYNIGKNFETLSPDQTTASGSLQGYFLCQLIVCVLGVLIVTGEYSTGMIRSTMAAVPARVPVILAKALVFLVVVGITMTVSTLIAFMGAQAFMSYWSQGYSLSDPGVLRIVLGTGLYLALIGLLAGALGWIVRSTPGAIAAIVGLLLVVPGLLNILPESWTGDIPQYLPGEAGGVFISTLQAPDSLSPTTGLLVLVLWVVGAMGVAAVLLQRRDV